MQGGEIGSLLQNSEQTLERQEASLSSELERILSAASRYSSLILCWPLQECIIRNMNVADIHSHTVLLGSHIPAKLNCYLPFLWC